VVKTLTMPALPITARRQEIACSHRPQEDLEAPCLNEMLGTVVHELRSPLASITIGVSAIAEEADVGPRSRRALASIEQQLWQAMRLVDDLFDLCAGGLGKLSVQKEVVEIADIIATAFETADKLITERQHQLTLSLPPQPLYLEADPLRLAQVLTNLLCNASKFTGPGGHIVLSASSNDGQIVIRVRDNGRGIAQNVLPHVFDLFGQFSDGYCTGGMGIGLALVKSLVELHDGTVAAYSNGPGTGSEFVVRLPAHAHRW
jgi:signal transduction histidine kinase